MASITCPGCGEPIHIPVTAVSSRDGDDRRRVALKVDTAAVDRHIRRQHAKEAQS